MNKKIFAGHESFNCRPLWLKKGYDFIKSGKLFSDVSAIVNLGVGKNMVNAIEYWMKSFDLLDSNKNLTTLAEFLFGENGKDPYLENPASLWLLHYSLIKTQKASLYSILFNNFRRERIEFTKDNLIHFVELQCERESISINRNSVKKDIDVLLKTYVKPQRTKRNFEEEYSGLFIDLMLIKRFGMTEQNEQIYNININEHGNIPFEIILFVILDQFENMESISFFKLMYDKNSPGICFSLNEDGLANHIKNIIANYNITFTEDAGIKELQINEKIDKWEIIKNCYEK